MNSFFFLSNFKEFEDTHLQEAVWAEPWARWFDFLPLFELDKVNQSVKVTVAIVHAIFAVFDADKYVE